MTALTPRPPEQGQADRALDVRIARDVFKVKKLFGFNGKLWSGGDDYPQFIPSGKPWRTHSIDAKTLPWFSSEIGAAWLVVERLREIGLDLMISTEDDGYWEVEVCTTEALYQRGYVGCYRTDRSLPKALCRAALFVVSGAAEHQQAGDE